MIQVINCYLHGDLKCMQFKSEFQKVLVIETFIRSTNVGTANKICKPYCASTVWNAFILYFKISNIKLQKNRSHSLDRNYSFGHLVLDPQTNIKIPKVYLTSASYMQPRDATILKQYSPPPHLTPKCQVC